MRLARRTRIADVRERRADGEVGRKAFNVMSHQHQVRMEMEEAHLVVGLIRGPMFPGHAVRGDHDPGAVVAEIAVHEDFLLWMVANQFQECGYLIVTRT